MLKDAALKEQRSCTYFYTTLVFCFRRMFPHCSISLSGLQPFANYVVMIDMVPADGFKYKVSAYCLALELIIWWMKKQQNATKKNATVCGQTRVCPL